MTIHPAVVPERAPAPARHRLAYIDNLRIFLTVLVVIHHAAVIYGNIPAFYYYEKPAAGTATALDVLVVFNQTFFMGFFFMLAGYFVPTSFDRKGGKRFMKERLLRLGVPLLLFAVLLRPVLTLWTYNEQYRDALPYWLFYLVSWDPGPMWFVEVLLVFCLGYLFIRQLRRDRQPATDAATRPGYTGRLPGPLAIVGFTVALTLVTFVWRLMVGPMDYWPVVGLPTPAYLPQYLGLFVVGVYAHRRGWFANLSRPTLWISAAATLLLGLARLVTIGLESDDIGTRLAQLAAESGFAVAIVLFLLALFQRTLNRQSRFSKFLADNAFGVYFWHSLVLTLTALLVLSGWEAPALAKFAVLAAIAIPATWALAGVLRRIPLVRKVF